MGAADVELSDERLIFNHLTWACLYELREVHCHDACELFRSGFGQMFPVTPRAAAVQVGISARVVECHDNAPRRPGHCCRRKRC